MIFPWQWRVVCRHCRRSQGSWGRTSACLGSLSLPFASIQSLAVGVGVAGLLGFGFWVFFIGSLFFVFDFEVLWFFFVSFGLYFFYLFDRIFVCLLFFYRFFGRILYLFFSLSFGHSTRPFSSALYSLLKSSSLPGYDLYLASLSIPLIFSFSSSHAPWRER